MLATTTASNQLIVEGPTQPKKLDKDAKLLFPPKNNSKKPKEAPGKIMTRQNTVPANLTVGTGARRNSEYQGSHLFY